MSHLMLARRVAPVLRSSAMLAPLQGQIRPFLIKSTFHTSSRPQSPYNIYSRSLFSKVMRYVPGPVKNFGAIALGTTVALLLAPGLIILVAPPLLIGSFWLWRRTRKLKAALYDQRWKDKASFHLTRDPSAKANSHIPYKARSRIFDAIVSNEQNLQSVFANPMNQDINFSELEGLYQDFKAGYGGISNTMQVEQYGMYMGGRRVATVNLVEKDKRMRIEIEPKGKRMIVLDEVKGDGSNIIIDVKKRE